MVFFFGVFYPLYFGGHDFFISNMFWTIFNVLDAPRGGLQVLFRHQKQQNPPLAAIL